MPNIKAFELYVETEFRMVFHPTLHSTTTFVLFYDLYLICFFSRFFTRTSPSTVFYSLAN